MNLVNSAGRHLREWILAGLFQRLVAVLVAIVVAGLGVPVLAAGSGSGYVTGVYVERSSGKFSSSDGHPGAPSCATTGRWAVDVSTTQGQAMWSSVLLAYSQNKPVTVGGTGTCSVWGDSETVAWIKLP